MLIFKMVSQLATALVAFAVGTGIVAGVQSVSGIPLLSTISPGITSTSKSQSGIYFTTPSVDQTNSSKCHLSSAELVPFGWNYILPSSQIPEIKRMARDGRWFFFETASEGGRSFEFFGIIPDSATGRAGQATISIPGKLIRLTNGEVSGNVDASYTAPACTFQ